MEKNDLSFSNNLKYILSNLKYAIDKAINLEDKTYFEMSKEEINNVLNYVYESIKDWQDNYDNGEYEVIINKYNEINSIISHLELCLVEFDNIFHIEGISYSLF